MPFAPRLRSRLLAMALLWMAVDNTWLLWRSRVPMAQGYGDFANFYTAGVLVHRGLGTEIYDAAAQWKVQQEFSAEVKMRRGPMRYLRPPFEAMLFSLFARWPYSRALLFWTCLKLVLLVMIPFIVVRDRPWREAFPRWAAAFLVLGTFPAFIDLLMGQDAILLAFLFAITFWQLETGREMGAGFTLGVALIKFQFAIPFVIMLWISGRKRVLPGFAVSASAVIAISSLIVGWRGLLQYPAYLLALNQATGVGIAPDIQITLRGLLTLVVGRSPYPGRIHWALVPLALAGISCAGLLWRRAGKRFLAEGFGLAAIVAIVTSYYAYTYDLLLLIVPLLAMRTRPDDTAHVDRLTRCLETSGSLLLLLTPLYWFVKIQLHAECLMALPLLAVGIALARRLSLAGADRPAVTLDGPP